MPARQFGEQKCNKERTWLLFKPENGGHHYIYTAAAGSWRQQHTNHTVLWSDSCTQNALNARPIKRECNIKKRLCCGHECPPIHSLLALRRRHEGGVDVISATTPRYNHQQSARNFFPSFQKVICIISTHGRRRVLLRKKGKGSLHAKCWWWGREVKTSIW